MPEKAYPFTTAILRFRDLVTKKGDTIRLHNEIIGAHKGVWWGWWSKAGEQIPDDAFRQLQKSARAGGVDLYLMDSGAQRAYRVRCVDLEWRNDHQRMKSPDEKQTPSYYTTQDLDYFAWFRFTSIEPVDETAVKSLTYVRVDDFFEDGPSRYGDFYDKRVYSIEELKQQDRTIWFVRPSTGTDPSHKVFLLDRRQIAPTHFTQDFLPHSSQTILWISDPHLAADEHHGFPLTSDPSTKSLGHAIEDACTKIAKVEKVAGIWVSGDLTWRALDAEFELAQTFLKRLHTWTNLDNYNYAVCPGNHDVKFSDDPSEKDKPVTIAKDEAVKAYSDFYASLFYLPPNEHLSSGRRYLLANGVAVEVVLLNSSLLQQTKGHFQGHGFVGDAQLEHVNKQYGWNKAPKDRPLRILIVHHHLLPVTYRERPISGRIYSTALDAEAVMRWAIEARVDLVLHGHMHQPFYSRVTRRVSLNDKGAEHTIAIVGAGSAGVAAKELGEVSKNTFATLTFSTQHADVKMYSLHSMNPAEEIWSATIPFLSRQA